MKLCNKCNTPHLKTGKFCCSACANSRSWTDEQKQQRSEQLKLTFSKVSKESLVERALKGSAAKRITTQKRLLESDIELLGHDARRKRVLIEQDYKCNKCMLTTWLDAPISLELDHKDGNKKNNKRENLECLCPNCHAQTPTWRGRNRNLPM